MVHRNLSTRQSLSPLAWGAQLLSLLRMGCWIFGGLFLMGIYDRMLAFGGLNSTASIRFGAFLLAFWAAIGALTWGRRALLQRAKPAPHQATRAAAQIDIWLAGFVLIILGIGFHWTQITLALLATGLSALAGHLAGHPIVPWLSGVGSGLLCLGYGTWLVQEALITAGQMAAFTAFTVTVAASAARFTWARQL